MSRKVSVFVCLKGSAVIELRRATILPSWKLEPISSLQIIFQLKDLQTRYLGDSAVVGQKRVAVTHQRSRHLDRIGRFEFKRCPKLCRSFEEATIHFDKPQTSAIGQQRLITIRKCGIAGAIRYDQDFHQTEAGCHSHEIAAIDRFEQRLYKRKEAALLFDKVDENLRIERNRAGIKVIRSIPLAPFPGYMFAGVNLFPGVLAKPLEI